MALNIALVGVPNAGKTTLFNELAGTHYHVANFPGITVERKFAPLNYNGREFILHDLPGTYSLTAFSADEKVTRDFVLQQRPDCVIQVADANNLYHHLYLTVQLIELKVPVILALNMMDIARKEHKEIKVEELAEHLKIEVFPIVARSGHGVPALWAAACQQALKAATKVYHNQFSYGQDIDSYLEMAETKLAALGKDARWAAFEILEGNPPRDLVKPEIDLSSIEEAAKTLRAHLQETLAASAEEVIAEYRYGVAKHLLIESVHQNDEVARFKFSLAADRLLTHRWLGPLILIGVLYLVYQFTFWASEYPVAWFEDFFAWLAEFASKHIPEGALQSAVVDGAIGGVGAVIGFSPLIFFMFFVMSFLEDSGYMARMAYMMDRIFKFFGMQGNSVVAYIVSGGIAGGCAVPGVMATRIIKGRKERLLTILTLPFMSCGAKLPIYALFVAAFFSHKKGLAMLTIVLGSWIFALFLAKIYSFFLYRGESSTFIMELPNFRMPTLKGMLLHAWERTWMYLRKAGTLILGVSIFLWAAMYFPQVSEDQVPAGEVQATYQLKNSYAGKIGAALEPITKVAGFDWRTNIALLGGFAAKEVVVSTLGTAYSLDEEVVEDEDKLEQSLAEKLKGDERHPGWPLGKALALLIFSILYAPCFATVIMIAKETGTAKWAIFSVVVNTAVAFGLATVAYQIFS